MFSLENLHNIEVLVFSNYSFSLEVLLDRHDAPSHFVKVSFTTHEVILAIAVWEKCFGLLIRPQRSETHVSFEKLAQGSWRVVLLGSKLNITKLLLATNFDIIRFQVIELSSVVNTLDETSFGYSIRVPLGQISCKLEIFLTEVNSSLATPSDSSSVASIPVIPPQFDIANSIDSKNYSKCGKSRVNSLPFVQSSNSTIEIFKNQSCSTKSDLSGGTIQKGDSVHETKIVGSSVVADCVQDNSPSWGRIPLRIMHEHSNENETTNDNVSQITETVRISKSEVSALVGPQCKRILMIQNATHCRISVLPVTLETMNSRFRTHELPQTISLTGKPHQVAHAKIMLRKALLEFRSK